jgi:hypothetical protein
MRLFGFPNRARQSFSAEPVLLISEIADPFSNAVDNDSRSARLETSSKLTADHLPYRGDTITPGTVATRILIANLEMRQKGSRRNNAEAQTGK